MVVEYQPGLDINLKDIFKAIFAAKKKTTTQKVTDGVKSQLNAVLEPPALPGMPPSRRNRYDDLIEKLEKKYSANVGIISQDSGSNGDSSDHESAAG